MSTFVQNIVCLCFLQSSSSPKYDDEVDEEEVAIDQHRIVHVLLPQVPDRVQITIIGTIQQDSKSGWFSFPLLGMNCWHNPIKTDSKFVSFT